MPSDEVSSFAIVTGLVGALIISAIGTRFTRNRAALWLGAGVTAIAIGTLTQHATSWNTTGFQTNDTIVLIAVGLVLFHVMAAQDWFVVYEDTEDFGISLKPTLALAVGAIAWYCVSCFFENPLAAKFIWILSVALAFFWSIAPVHRCITVNRSILIGLPVGVCKVLVPLLGFVTFIFAGLSALAGDSDERETLNETLGRIAFLLVLWALLAALARLSLSMLINGERVAERTEREVPVEVVIAAIQEHVTEPALRFQGQENASTVDNRHECGRCGHRYDRVSAREVCPKCGF